MTSLTGLIRAPRRRNTQSEHASAAPAPLGSSAGSPLPAETDAEAEAEPSLRADGEGDGDEDEKELENIQIMSLDSPNPVISYRNHIFQCEWSDLIGTEMTMTRPEGPMSELQRLRQSQDERQGYDLISTSQAKLLCRKANLVIASQQQQKQEGADKTRFIDQLASIKQQKGETDTVRTSSTSTGTKRKAQSLDATASRKARLQAWERTEARVAEVERLQELARLGDEEAAKGLEEQMAAVTEQARAEASRREQGEQQQGTAAEAEDGGRDKD